MTCASLRAYLISTLLLAAVASPALGNEKKLEKWLRAGSWSKGVEYCDRALAGEVSRRPDLRNVSTEYLARLAVDCAALASGKGDEFSSGWWWYTAASIDLKTALNLLPEMRKMGLLQTLPAARNRGPSYEPKPGDEKKVRLLSGEIVPGIPPKPVTRLKAPDYMFRVHPIVGAAAAYVAVEFVVSRDGLPRQPLLVDVHALPVHVFFAYHHFSAWRFEPARVNDEPVDSLYGLSVSVQTGE